MMKITGGAHLVNFISSDISDGQLNLVNRNKCNFLRSYKHELTVELHVVQLSEIQFEGTKPLRCETAIVGNNLSVFIRDGAGEVSLNVDCNNLNCVVTNGWGNFDISGTTQNLDLNIRSNGFGSTYNLSVEQQLRVISNTSGLLKVNADGADCMIQMQSVGDIWFIGTPANVSLSDQGEGEWIDKN
jgi:hypothetical protein